MSLDTDKIERQQNITSIKWNKIFALILFLYALLEFTPIYPRLNTVYLGFLTILSMVIYIFGYKKILFDIHNAEVYLFLFFWLAISLLSVLWAKNAKAVLSYSILIAHYIPIFLIFSTFFMNLKNQRNLVIFYQFIALAYLGISVWELISGNHLPGSKHYGEVYPIPSGPFYSENMLAAFWLILVPYLMVPSWLNKGYILGTITLLCTIGIYLIIILQSARIAIIALAVAFLIYLVTWASNKIRISFLLIIILIPLYFSHFQPNIWLFVKGYTESQLQSLHNESESAEIGSIQIRIHLIKEGIDMLVGKGLVGVGSGNFEEEMSHGRSIRTGNIINPHSYGVEILSSFGLIVFLGFLYMYLFWIVSLWKLMKKCSEEMKPFYRANFLSLLMFLPASSLPSSIRIYFLVWIYFAGIHSTCIRGNEIFAKNTFSSNKLNNSD
ncbi:MAG TPA: O-antigen ligase family protein [Candidatus Cloacimonadota bacterium]|nr:O-antigen ligase family protein [Candidatus Cloacimonadota bacterium]